MLDSLKRDVKMTDLMKAFGYVGKSNGNSVLYKCIFHTDNSPSMSVTDDLGKFHCFGCGKSGDIFNLLDGLKHGLNFKEKINFVSRFISRDYNNSSIKEVEKPIKFEITDEFLYLMNEVSEYYISQLKREVLEKYLLSKDYIKYSIYGGKDIEMNGYNLSIETIQKFKIGYSPNTKELYNLLISKYSEELINKVGLFDSKGMPIFKNRIVVPFINDGSVFYFTARQTEYTPKSEYELAKYKNQRINNDFIYNIDVIEEDILNIHITEGIFDCLALENIGLKSISLGGVNINSIFRNEKLIDFLKKNYFNFICFDNDETGIIKAKELNNLFKENGIESNLITLDKDKDLKKIDVNLYFCNKSKEDFSKYYNQFL